MENKTVKMLFSLLRSAVSGNELTGEEKNLYKAEMLSDLLKISSKHDVTHLLVLGLKQNALLREEDAGLEQYILKALYRYQKTVSEQNNIIDNFPNAEIPFILLKGAVLRKYYREEWMRTSCDIDVLIPYKFLDKATEFLTQKVQYTFVERNTHDVSFTSPSGVHIELHFDLVEEGRANNAINILRDVWENALKPEKEYQFEMNDDFFYFYHIAHMAKHFENGGCGIRPFIDLWILDNLPGVDTNKRDELLNKGGLKKFADSVRNLSLVWFGEKEPDEISIKMQNFLLRGGVFGSTDNRVALKRTKSGGKFRYIMSRIFAPMNTLKRYYPVLEKHPYLMPVMQVRRWFMLLKPDVKEMAKRELEVNKNVGKSLSDDMSTFLDDIGL